MNKPLHIDAPNQSITDMLGVLADPDKFRTRMAELQAQQKAVVDAIGIYNSLEKVNAYRQEVKVEAAAVAKSHNEAQQLWGKIKQASEDVALRKQELDEYKASLDERHAENVKALDKTSTALQSAQAAHEDDLTALDAAKAKLHADRAKHDAMKATYKEKLDKLREAMQAVVAL